jgi:hypothetical protein
MARKAPAEENGKAGLVLLFTPNSIRQGFYSPVALRKLAVVKFYPDL